MTQFDWDSRNERPFSAVSHEVREAAVREVGVLDYMAATYRTIGDVKSAEAIESELFQLQAAAMTHIGADVRRLGPLQEHRNEPATTPFTADQAMEAVFRAQNAAQTFRHATAQRKPSQVVNYLANREIGRK